MRRLYLIRHATPAIQPSIPEHEWPISDRGIEQARLLAEAARTWGLQALYASRQPKAQSTAAVIGEVIGLPVNVVDGLEELRIGRWIPNSDEFSETVRQILEQPALSLRGAERAAAAATRFAAAVSLIEAGPFPAALVSHGRVLTSWLASIAGIEDPFALWRSIPMPGWASIDLDAPRAGLINEFQD
jgi:broad specificity phosphatase PhoE